jgi:hypothetical protein
MIETVFQTEDLPQTEWFTIWHELTRRALLPSLIRREHAANFLATLHLLDFGAVQAGHGVHPLAGGGTDSEDGLPV